MTIRPRSTTGKRIVGMRGEDLAIEHLQQKGFELVERNYRFERGEIDAVMRDADELVFVEIKARRSSAYGAPEDAVTAAKRNQIRRVAEGFLFEHEIRDIPCRFDVVAVRWKGSQPEITHIVNAF